MDILRGRSPRIDFFLRWLTRYYRRIAGDVVAGGDAGSPTIYFLRKVLSESPPRAGHPRIDRWINPADRYKALWVVVRCGGMRESAILTLSLAFTNTFSGQTKRRTNARYHTDPGLQERIACFAFPHFTANFDCVAR